MRAKPRQKVGKDVGQATEVVTVSSPSAAPSVWTVAAPYLDILARESATSIGKKAGAILLTLAAGFAAKDLPSLFIKLADVFK